ncbi:MAG: hypothetical protein ACFN4D_08885, partial [Cardiobacterium sp.]
RTPPGAAESRRRENGLTLIPPPRAGVLASLQICASFSAKFETQIFLWRMDGAQIRLCLIFSQK